MKPVLAYVGSYHPGFDRRIDLLDQPLKSDDMATCMSTAGADVSLSVWL